jgi:hypothetical protein
MPELNDTEQEHLDDNQVEIPDDESPLNGTLVADTSPPPSPAHNFLEQWTMFEEESLTELRAVCKLGLTPQERTHLVLLGIQLVALGGEGSSEEEFKDHPELIEQIHDALDQLISNPISALTHE